MFNLFSSKRDKFQERLGMEVRENLATITNVLNAQIDVLVFFERLDHNTILKDRFTPRYIFGAFDAATIRWGTDIRQKIGPSIIKLGYVTYLTAKFDIDLKDATESLEAMFAEHSADLMNEAIMAGGTDGMEALQGKMPRRLGMHFIIDPAAQTSLSEQEILDFGKYKEAELTRFLKRRDEHG